MAHCESCGRDDTVVVTVNNHNDGLAAVLIEIQHMKGILMTAVDDLNAQLSTLRDGQQQLVDGQTELIKDQGRILAKLADVLAGQNPDLSAATALVQEMQAKNDAQLQAVQAADAALEAADPETPPVV